MIYLIPILLSTALFGGFLALTYIESRRGRRVAQGLRARLDERVSRGAFVARHVDWGAFINHAVRSGMEHLAHEIAHAILIIVRAAERILTRFVRYLRERRPMTRATLAERAQHMFERFRRRKKLPEPTQTETE